MGPGMFTSWRGSEDAKKGWMLIESLDAKEMTGVAFVSPNADTPMLRHGCWRNKNKCLLRTVIEHTQKVRHCSAWAAFSFTPLSLHSFLVFLSFFPFVFLLALPPSEPTSLSFWCVPSKPYVSVLYRQRLTKGTPEDVQQISMAVPEVSSDELNFLHRVWLMPKEKTRHSAIRKITHVWFIFLPFVSKRCVYMLFTRQTLEW